MKYREIARHSARKQSKDNIYAEQSEAGNFFEKKSENCVLGLPNLGVRVIFLIATIFSRFHIIFP